MRELPTQLHEVVKVDRLWPIEMDESHDIQETTKTATEFFIDQNWPFELNGFVLTGFGEPTEEQHAAGARIPDEEDKGMICAKNRRRRRRL